VKITQGLLVAKARSNLTGARANDKLVHWLEHFVLLFSLVGIEEVSY
jgi:hypothetical protein